MTVCILSSVFQYLHTSFLFQCVKVYSSIGMWKYLGVLDQMLEQVVKVISRLLRVPGLLR